MDSTGFERFILLGQVYASLSKFLAQSKVVDVALKDGFKRKVEPFGQKEDRVELGVLNAALYFCPLILGDLKEVGKVPFTDMKAFTNAIESDE